MSLEPGAALVVFAELDPGDRTANLDREGPGGNVARETGSGRKVEAPTVVDADEVCADDLAVDERVSRRGARVLDRVDRLADAKDGDSSPVRLDESSPLGFEQLERNRVPGRARP